MKISQIKFYNPVNIGVGTAVHIKPSDGHTVTWEEGSLVVKVETRKGIVTYVPLTNVPFFIQEESNEKTNSKHETSPTNTGRTVKAKKGKDKGLDDSELS